MEGIYNRIPSKDKDISKLQEMFLKDRRAVEDLGKTNFTRKKDVSSTTTKMLRSSQQSSQAGRPSSSSSLVAPDRRKAKRVIEISDIDDDSDDEMDCLSSQLGDYDDPSSSQMPIRKSSPSDSWDIRATSKKKSFIDSNGTAHEPDPKYLATSSIYATLKFNKNKKPEDGSAGSSQKSSSFQLTKDTATEKKDSTSSPPYGSPSLSGPRRIEPSARDPACSQESVAADAPKPRPKPRPIIRGPIIKANPSIGTQSKEKKAAPSSSQTSTTRRMLDMVDIDTTPKPSLPLRRKDRSRSRSNSPGRSKKAPPKQELEAFPAPSPLSTPVKKKRSMEAFPDMSPLAESMSQEMDKPDFSWKQSSTSGIPRRFPMSPISITSPQRGLKVVPDRKGKGKIGDVNEKKGKNRRIVESSEEQTEDSESNSKKKRGVLRKKPAAFPMGTQMLVGIESPDRQIFYSPPRSIKRSSEGGSGDEHSAKKSRRVQELIQDSPTRHPFEEGDSISLDPQIDPKSLCPYCDIPLPSSPSPLLLRLLSTTKLKSYKDARPANPLGRKAPLAVFATVCQRHRFESKLLPEAESKGWPKTINWKRLEGRIGRMKSQLKALMQSGGDSDEDSDIWEVLHTGNSNGSTKHKSIFWGELLDEIKKKGLKSISGVQGQFDNFEKAQPGYYGELGSVIIHQTLYNMFPPTSIDATIIAPLTVNQFLQHVLVPEVALRLIMEDKSLKGDSGMQKALIILRDSSAYGVAMFPEDTNEQGKRPTKNDTDKLGVGDLIVMERARKRRKELEEEEEQERVDEEEEEKKALTRRQKAELEEKEQARLAESNASLPAPRPRPKPIIKSQSRMHMSSTDTEAKPNGYRSPSRSRSSRSARNGGDTDTDSSADEEARQSMKNMSSSSPNNNDPRRSLSASETRNENFFDELDDTPRRAPSLEVAAMDINASDRRSTAKAKGRSRASSRVPASSPTRHPTVTRARSRASSYRSRSESSSGVEILSDAPVPSSEQTPVPRKNVRPLPTSTSMDITEDTPVRGSTPPLVKAARRKQLGLQGNKAEKKTSGAPVKKYTRQTIIQDEYGWLLSSSQSQ